MHTFHLNENKFTQEQINCLVQFINNSNNKIKKLDLSNNNLDPEDILLLGSNIKDNQNIEEADFKNNPGFQNIKNQKIL